MQIIKVENSIEDKEVAALRFAAPEWIIREDYNLSLIKRYINHRRVLRTLAASCVLM